MKCESKRKVYNERELTEIFRKTLQCPVNSFKAEIAQKGIIIDSKLRKDLLTGPNQGFVTINGRVCKMKFVDLKGGVWNCSIDIKDVEKMYN